MSEDKCYLWETRWTGSMPDYVVRRAIEKKVINPACLPEERKKRMGLAVEETKGASEKKAEAE